MALPYTKTIRSLNIPLHMDLFFARDSRECGENYETSHNFGLRDVV
jgi:hypothetical protein